MTMFITAQELRTYLDGGTLDDEADAEWIAQAELVIQMISADIQRAARNSIVADTTTALLAGSWDNDLELPRRPVTAVSAVSVNGSVIAAPGFTWNDRSLIRRWSDFDGDGSLGPSDGVHWGGPASTISVTYSTGYPADGIPDYVKSLALRIAARTIDQYGGTIAGAGGVTQHSLGPFSESFGGNRSISGESTGSHVTDREAKMLRHLLSRTAGTIGAGTFA